MVLYFMSSHGMTRPYSILSVNTRDELVLHNLAVLLPVLAILDGASFEIAPASMNKNSYKEEGVEVWNGRRSSDAKTPCETLYPVCGVILTQATHQQGQRRRLENTYRLARICPPATSQKAISA